MTWLTVYAPVPLSLKSSGSGSSMWCLIYASWVHMQRRMQKLVRTSEGICITCRKELGRMLTKRLGRPFHKLAS